MAPAAVSILFLIWCGVVGPNNLIYNYRITLTVHHDQPVAEAVGQT